MILIDQEQTVIFLCSIEHTLRKPAFAEHAEENIVSRKCLMNFCCVAHLFFQRKVYRCIHRLGVKLAFSGKHLLVLMVYGYHIYFCIAVKIIQPLRADVGRYKRNRSVSAQIGKDVPADVLIHKCHKFLYEILVDLIQHNLRVV